MTSRNVPWVVMTALALLVAGYTALVLLLPGFGPPFIGERRIAMPLALFAHLAGGMLALALGPWQLNETIRNRGLGRHRWIGRVYVIAALVGGIGGLAMAPVSVGGFVTHIGFGMLAVLWLYATVMAWHRIRARDQVAHRRWMIRSYALTLAAVTLRIYVPLTAVLGIPFEEGYQAISWFCWVPNLVVAEWIILRRGEPLAKSAQGLRDVIARSNDVVG